MRLPLVLDSIAWIIIYAIAVYRFTLMLYEDDGPFFIFVKLRSWVGISHTINTETDPITVSTDVSDNFLAQLLSCPYCISVWLAIPAAVGVYYHWFDFLAVIGCIAGLVHFALKKAYY